MTKRTQANSIFDYLTQEELRRLFKVIKASSKRDYAIFLLAYRHGLRVSEIGELTKDDIDFTRAKIAIRRLKNSYGGQHPLRPDELKALRAYLRTRTDTLPYLFTSRLQVPIARNTLHVLMQKYGELAQIPKEKRHFHALKHSIATHMLEAGADIIDVKDWLGHMNIQNTMEYAKITNPRREAVYQKVLRSEKIV